MSVPNHTATITTSKTHAPNTILHDFVPAHVETNQSGDRNAIRSGRKPLPTPSATNPQKANRPSPYKHNQQQDNVNRKKRARLRRSGPPTLASHNTRFTNIKNPAPPPSTPDHTP